LSVDLGIDRNGKYTELPQAGVRQTDEFIGRNSVLISLREMSSSAKKNPLAKREEYTGSGRCCRKLAFPVNDSAFGQIVRREFDPNPVAWHDADKVLAHPTGDVRQNDVSTFDLNAKTSIGQRLGNCALDLESFFLLFCHTRLCPVN
jgi:hypothetical protein